VPDLVRRRRPPEPLVASAQVITPAQLGDRTLFTNEGWQDEAWSFLDSLGEFNYGVGWLSQALSRVRLLAAEQVPGGDEPEPLTEGPAADLMELLGGGIGGRAAVMRSLGTHLAVPGEGWLVGEREDATVPLELATWTVRSTDEIQESRSRDAMFEVRDGDRDWRPLFYDSLVCRIWEPHKRWSWRADSSARSAIPIMREIDLYNRHIIATLVSRLAMNGILLIPSEGTILVPEQYANAPDPFVAMLVDVASNNIKNPGSASASIPIPIRFSSDLIEKWKHLTFGGGVDKDLLDARDKAIGRLATTLNLPAEVLKGIADMNHWSSWQLEESGIKLHISPVAETIVGGLTLGYLHPMLKSIGQPLLGPHGGKIVSWYDLSELAARPDKSVQAQALYDRIEISGAALRRESGFDEGDAPDPVELKTQVLKQLTKQVQLATQALKELTGLEIAPPTPVAGAPQPSGPGGDGNGSPGPSPAVAPATGPPGTRAQPPPPPGGTPPAANLPVPLVPLAPVNGRRIPAPATRGR
jgi:hypothetical protein